MSIRSRIAAHIWNNRPKRYTRETARRLRQIKAGTLQGSYIADEARYHAIGLMGPTDIRLIATPEDK